MPILSTQRFSVLYEILRFQEISRDKREIIREEDDSNG